MDPGSFLSAGAQLLNISKIMNERGKTAGGESRTSPPDPQELLWEPFPAIDIVARSLQRPCSDGPGLVYGVSAQTLLLINCKCDFFFVCFFARLAWDQMTD